MASKAPRAKAKKKGSALYFAPRGTTVTITCNDLEPVTFAAGGYQRFAYDPPFVMANGQILFADGTHAFTILVIDESSGGELWDYGLFMNRGCVFWSDFRTRKDCNGAFASCIGKSRAAIWPFEYRYDALLDIAFDCHVKVDGWSGVTEIEQDDALFRRYCKLKKEFFEVKHLVEDSIRKCDGTNQTAAYEIVRRNINNHPAGNMAPSKDLVKGINRKDALMALRNLEYEGIWKGRQRAYASRGNWVLRSGT